MAAITIIHRHSRAVQIRRAVKQKSAKHRASIAYMDKGASLLAFLAYAAVKKIRATHQSSAILPLLDRDVYARWRQG